MAWDYDVALLESVSEGTLVVDDATHELTSDTVTLTQKRNATDAYIDIERAGTASQHLSAYARAADGDYYRLRIVLWTGTRYLVYLYRGTTQIGSYTITGSGYENHLWRLKVRDSTIEVYSSPDGITWTLERSETDSNITGPGDWYAAEYAAEVDFQVLGAQLVVNDATHALTSDNVVLGQVNDLKVDDASHVITSDTVTLGEGATEGPWDYDVTLLVESVTQTLVIDDVTHAITSETPALTRWDVLAAAHATDTYTDSDVVYGGDYIYRVTDADGTVVTSDTAEFRGIIIDDATHVLTSDTPTLVVDKVLAVNDATHALTSDQVKLTQHQILVTADSTHAITSDGVTLIEHDNIQLAVDDAVHAVTSDTVALSHQQTLAVDDATHELTSDEVALVYGGHHKIAVDDATHAMTSDEVALAHQQSLAIDAAFHAMVSEEPVLQQAHVLEVNDATHVLTSTTVNLGEAILIHRTALGGRYGPTALKGRDARVTSLGGRVDGSS